MHASRADWFGKYARAPLFLVTVLAWNACSLAGDIREVTALFRSGKYAECVESATQGISQNSSSEPLRLVKIRAEMELGRYAQALQTLDAALPRFPQSIQLRFLGRDVCKFNQQLGRVDTLDAEIYDVARRTPWRYGDVANQVVVGQWMLVQRTEPKKVLETIFNEAKRQQPSRAEVHLASGQLALDKHDYQLAAESFQQAVKLDAENADAHFGLALAFASSDGEKAQEAIQKAIELNPKHVNSLLFVVDSQIDSERYAEADEALRQVESVNPNHPRALAYRAVLDHLNAQPQAERQHREAALKFWPQNPEVDHLIGRKLSQKYRFAQGSKYQRQALEFDHEFLPAKEQLAQDLLRLGQEAEGMRLAEEVYREDGYNVLAHNLVTLQENLAKFRTLEDDGFMVRMEAREADLYGARVLDLLKRAKRTLCAKYAVELPTPVIVEIFPRQEDFAIRTFGMPGGVGFLGVCFGTVITANSPASQGAHPTCWEATLWHEFCHVVTLTKTNNAMPRWLSEGISVYEELQESAAWGQSINAKYRELILGDGLTPVSKLSGAFLRPPSPLHLQFAYFESSLVVQFLVEKHGIDKLKRILVDLGVGMPINEALARYTGSIDALDRDFAAYAKAKAESMAPGADWTTPELPRRATREAIAAWLSEHPKNYPALGRLAQQLIAEKKLDAAKEVLERMLNLYPNDAEPGSASVLLAHVCRELGDKERERSLLEKQISLSADDFDELSRLGELAVEANEWSKARDYALKQLAIDPLVPLPHRRAAMAAEHLEDWQLAVSSQKALLRLEPADPAEAHFRLASALFRLGDRDLARRHALLALEETPRYRDAQRLLLEIVDTSGENALIPGGSPGTAVPAPATD